MIKKLHLTSAQYNIWVDQKIHMTSRYNIGGYIRLMGDLDKKAFHESVKQMVINNDAFALQLETDSFGTPLQHLCPWEDYSLTELDFSREREQVNAALNWMNNRFSTPFDLENSPLFELALLKVSEKEHYYMGRFHHLIMDGWAVSLSVKQIAETYNAITQGKENLKGKEFSYLNYIEDDENYIMSERYNQAVDFWKAQKLSQVEPLLNAPVFTHPEEAHGPALRESFFMNREEYRGIKDLSSDYNVTTANFLTGVTALLLNRITGRDEVIIGLPLLNRPKKSYKKTLGLFTDTSPLKIKGERQWNFSEFLAEIKTSLSACYRHQRLPASVIEKNAGTEAGHALSEVVLSLEPHAYNVAFNGLESGGVSLPPHYQSNALTIHVEETPEGTLFHFDYRPDVFKDFTIDQFIHLYKTLLLSVKDSQTPLGKLNILPPSFADSCVIYGGEKPLSTDMTITDLLEKQASRTPENTALRAGKEETSYKELHERANALAWKLKEEFHLQKGDLAALIMEPSPDLMITLLAVLKTGAGYLPLDPSYPKERIEYILEDAKPRVILSDQSEKNQWGAMTPMTEERSEKSPLEISDPDSVFYVIYTSGTTGKPKGTVLTHNNGMHYLSWSKDYYCTGSVKGNFPLFTSLSFDLTVTSLFLPLMKGACLEIFPREMENAQVLENIFTSNTIDCVKLTPSHISLLKGMDLKSSIALAIVGGEELLPEQVQILKNLNPAMRIVNEYGPTEATVGCIVKEITSSSERILIGRPIDNTRIFLADREQNPLPPGVPGEICIAGTGVAREYLGRKELTEEKFLYSEYLKEKIYRTGDLARITASGEVDFLGRIDMQVKIRGHRIEPAEVENTLLTMEGILQAAVTVQTKKSGEKFLGAYYTSHKEITPHSIREYLGKKLSNAMIPSLFKRLETMPLTPNGKTDKRALPALEPSSSQTVYAPAETPEQEVLLNLWQDMFSSEAGIDHNFFDLGGDSIKAIQMTSFLKACNYSLKVSDVFSYPTIRALAPHMTLTLSENYEKVIGDVPPGPVQKWFFQNIQGNMNHYNQALLFQIRKEVKCEHLKDAALALMDHHDMLRATFEKQEETYSQKIHSHLPLRFESHTPENSDEKQSLIHGIQEEFDITKKEALIRFDLFDFAGNKELLITAHHLIIDGVSWHILTEDLERSLMQLQKGENIVLPGKSISYKEWTCECFTSDCESFAEFPKQISGLPEGEPSSLSVSKALLDESTTETLLNSVHRVYNTNTEDLLLTAVSRALNSWTGEDSFSVDIESHGRSRDKDLTRTVGWFTTMNPSFLTYEEDRLLHTAAVKEREKSPNEYYVWQINEGKISSSEILFNYLGSSDFNKGEFLSLISHDPGNTRCKEIITPYKLTWDTVVHEKKLVTTLSSSHYREEELDKITCLFKQELILLIEALNKCDFSQKTLSDFTLKNLTEEEYESLLKEGSLDKRDVEDIYSLTPLQEGFLFHALMEKESEAYFEQILLELTGTPDYSRIREAWQKTAQRHPVLRTSFIPGFRIPVQIVKKEQEIPVTLCETLNNAEIESLQKRDKKDFFDLTRAPLFRVTVLPLGDNRVKILLSFHHIILDGWSMPLIIKDFLDFYEGKTLPPPPLYSDFIKWHRTMPDSLDFWQKELEDYSELATLPGDLDRKREHGEYPFSFSKELTDKLVKRAASNSTTLNTVIQSLWGILLSAWNNQEDVVFGTTVSGRPRELKGADMTPGLFINTIPVRVKTGKLTYEESLHALKDHSLRALDHHHASLAEIQNTTGLKESLLDHILVFENYPLGDVLKREGELSLEKAEFSEQINYDFGMTVLHDRGLHFSFKYNKGKYSKERLKLISGHLKRAAEAVADNAQVLLSEIDILTPGEVIFSEEYNSTETPYDYNKTMASLFEEQAEKTPENTALILGNKTLSYRELNIRANRMAHKLLKEGVRPGERIAVMAERNFEQTAALMAVLKAGGTYVPLDPDYPEDRVEYILSNSEAQWLLQDRDYPLTTVLSVNTVSTKCCTDESLPCDNPRVEKDPCRLAYIIYTSGSTGRPKGVMIEHHSAVNLIQWVNTTYNVGERDRLLFITSVCFDLSVYDIFGILAAGGALVIAQKEEIRNPETVFSLLKEHKITFWDSVPSTFNYVIDAMEGKEYLHEDLRLVFMSGDWIPVNLPRKIQKFFPRAEQVSLGGATEGTVWSVFHPIDPDKNYKTSIPYGKPLQNNRFYILDNHLRPVPRGAAGELWIGGAGVARGYMNDPEKTAYSYRKDIYTPGSLMYRTGDYGRMLLEGVIEFLGRKDSQVKVRGFRIELGEIETQLLKHINVVSALVHAPEIQGQRELAAYCVTTGENSVTPQELKSLLEESLPDYMIPGSITLMESFPLTANGKIDRKALPLPGAETGNEILLPRTETEKVIAEIWKEVLGRKVIGINQNFFESGGHSLKATSVLSRINSTLGKEVALQEFFSHPTIESFASVVESSRESVFSAINAVEEQESYELSHAQKRLWILNQMEENSLAYNMPGSFILQGEFSEEAFQAAYQTLLERHESLRTVFVMEKGETRQKILKTPGYTIEIQDLRKVENSEEHVYKLAEKDMQTPFDLEKGPLIRFSVLRTHEDRYAVIFNMHHIISDGWSMNIMPRDFLRAYNSFRRGVQPDFMPLNIHYKEYSLWQKELLKKPEILKQKDYWQKKLANPPVLELPGDKGRPGVQTFRGETRNYTFNKDITNGLQTLCRKENVSLFMVLQALIKTLFHRYTGQEDILLGSPVAGRRHKDLEEQIGFYVNTLVFRDTLHSDMPFSTFLQQVKETCTEAFDNQDYPFDLLVDELGLKRDLSRSPLFDVMLILQNNDTTDIELDGLDVTPFSPEKTVSKFDISLEFTEGEEELVCSVEYNCDIYQKERINRMMAHLKELILSVTEDIKKPLSTLNILPAEEMELLLYGFNKTEAPWPSDETIISLFEKQVEKTPEAPAVLFGDIALSYSEFNREVNRTAHWLKSHYGIGKDDLVGVLLNRSQKMMIALMAIQKAGGAYVPIDPAYPAERIAYIMEDAAPKLLITQGALSGEICEMIQGTPCEDISEILKKAVSEGDLSYANPPLPEPGDLAYVIYTSGSTGQPKGTLIEHGSLVNRLHWMQKNYTLTEEDTILQKTTYTFDVSVWELFWWSITGASVCFLPQGDEKDPEALIRAIEKYSITTMHFVPSMYTLFLSCSESLAPGRMKSLKQIFLSGEELTLNQVKKSRNLMEAGTRIINLYGPTEATIDVTYYNCTGDEDLIPIGKPIDNTSLLILDENRNPVPQGVPGELCIGGVNLARGYLNKEELTREKFIKNPFREGERLYSTGDSARWLEDGNIEFLGRIDNQVKIRGFRIELGEIENKIREYPGISSAVVTVKKDSMGDKALSAYYTADEESINVSSLQEENTDSWKDVFQDTYDTDQFDADARFVIEGWNSSYTGEPIDPLEMKEWVEDSVGRILLTEPGDVYEIGSGSGLLLYRIAPQARSYYGVDFSGEAVNQVNRVLHSLPELKEKTRVECRNADNFDGIQKESFDTIIINSVAQYFPNLAYLERVIKHSLTSLKTGGRLFLGDIRNYNLINEFHTSVNLFQHGETLSHRELIHVIQGGMKEENELLAAPEFFLSLKERLSEISHMEIKYKESTKDNELNKFRYDVILHKGKTLPATDSLNIREISAGDFTAETLVKEAESVLRNEKPEILRIKKVENTLLSRDLKAAELMHNVSSLEELKRQMEEIPASSPILDRFKEVTPRGYHMDVLWAGSDNEGFFDIVYTEKETLKGEFQGIIPLNNDVRELKTYGNNPLLREIRNVLKKELRNTLKNSLPEYMVPSHFMLLEEFPLTHSGKVDRKALPDPEVTLSGNYTPPYNEIQKKLTEIWQEVLGLDRIGIHDNFFDLGGHSLKGTSVVSRVMKEMDKKISLKDIFACPTIEDLGALIKEADRKGYSEITPVEERENYPLSHAQRRLWVLDQLDEGSIAYNMPGAFMLTGAFNEEAFKKAWQWMIRRHESLRTIFIMSEGEPRQKVLENPDFTLHMRDLREEENPMARALVLSEEEINTPFDLTRGPLIRLSLLRTEDEQYVLLFNMHHIISDGWSLSIFLRDFLTACSSYFKGEEPELPELTVQYKDYTQWQNTLLLSETAEIQKNYWLKQLSGELPVLNLPGDKTRPAYQSYNGKNHELLLPKPLSRKLNALCKEQGVSLFMLLHALVKALFYRYTGQEDIILGSPVAGRVHEGLEDQIGFFVNTLVFRDSVKGDYSFTRLLEGVKENITMAFEHQDYPFDSLVEDLNLKRDLSRSPLFDVMLILQNNETRDLSLEGVKITRMERERSISKFDITLEFTEIPEGLYCNIEYNIDIYFKERIEALARHFKTLAASAAESPETQVKNLTLLPDEEKSLLERFNNTDFAWNRDETIVSLFEKQARETPDSTALITGNTTLTYRELNARASIMAFALRKEYGLKPGERAGVLLKRTGDMMAALLAILKTGAAYIPMDPSFPGDRIRYMAEDGEPSVIIAREPPGNMPWTTPEALIKAGKEEFITEPGLTGEDTAYVIYTSGSTGKPKGTVLPHRAVVNFIYGMRDRIPFTPEKRIVSVTTISFDIFVLESFVPLSLGQTIVLAGEEEQADPAALASLMETHSADMIQTTPSRIKMLTEDEEGLRVLRTLSEIMVGGEAFPPELHRTLRDNCRGEIFNMYGPTETTVWSSVACLTNEEKVHIGQPIFNTAIHIIDRDGNQVPPGIYGELCIGGEGLAHGYFNREELTKEKFLMNPFNSCERIYRTGDRAAWNRKGYLDFAGRMDNQVKIRGYRIEPGEIEAQMEKIPGISNPVVHTGTDDMGNKFLTAYYTEAEEQNSSEEAVESHINSWQSVYENNYIEEDFKGDSRFAIGIWKNSYTGEQMADSSMAEWVDNTVKRILSLKPRRVYEIGCGSGLLLYRVAPHCESYRGADFSDEAVYHVEKTLDDYRELREKASAEIRVAHDFQGIKKNSFDTLVLNSVAQYFPDASYLTQVIGKALEVIEAGGSLFLGDIRNYRLMELFHSSITRFQNPENTNEELLKKCERAMEQENELLLAPEYFYTLKELFPRITHVEILYKEEKEDNELSLFRYDVILHVEKQMKESSSSVKEWKELADIHDVKTLLERDSSEALIIKNVPRGRLSEEWKELASLKNSEYTGEENTPYLRDFQNLVGDDYRVEPHWAGSGRDQESHLIITKEVSEKREAVIFKSFEPEVFSEGEMNNNPLELGVQDLIRNRVRNHLSDVLPDYMVPSFFMLLEEMPLTPNGKVDRKALPSPVAGSKAGSFTAPEGELEESLAQIWQEVLGTGPIGIHDDFFDLGGHSLKATSVVSRISKEMEKQITLRDIFNNPTISRLASLIEEAESSKKRTILPAEKREFWELSPAQKRMWVLEQFDGNETAYSMPGAWTIEGELNRAAFEKAYSFMIQRHDSLRTVFRTCSGEPRQTILNGDSFKPHFTEGFTCEAGESAEEKTDYWLKEELTTPFDLEKGPLIRCSLMKTGDKKYVMLFNMHHIISDGWSLGVLAREFFEAYRAFSKDEMPLLKKPELQYTDYSQWMNNRLNNHELDCQREYWHKRFQGEIPLLNLPSDSVRPARQSFNGREHTLYISPEMQEGLNALCREHNVSLFMVLMALLKTLFHRYTGQEDIIIGSALAGRIHRELEDQIGLFLNTLAFRDSVRSHHTFSHLLKEVKETSVAAFENQEYPFDRLVSELDLTRDLSRTPLFDVFMILQNTPPAELQGEGVVFTPCKWENTISKFDMTFEFTETEEGLKTTIQYNTDIYSEERIVRMGEHLTSLMNSVIHNSRKALWELDLLGEEEKSFVKLENRTSWPEHLTLVDLFEEAACNYPDNTALIYKEKSLTYRELNENANKVAHYLKDKEGFTPGTLAAVLMDKSELAVTAFLGILKAGGAYVPLDPVYPEERISHILEDSGAALLITNSDREFKNTISLKEIMECSSLCENPEKTASPEDLAYVIYTSGSTGKPKGALIEHRNVVRLLFNEKNLFDFSEKDVWTVFHSLCFDFSVWEIYGALLYGGTAVIVAPETARDTEGFLKLLKKEGVTVLNQTPTAFYSLAAMAQGTELPVRYVIFGGEALEPSLLKEWHRERPECTLVNMYGITETTVHVTYKEITEREIATGQSNIGVPIPTLSTYIVDKYNNLMPVGVPGELCVAGEGVGRGYLNRPELTEERFTQNPFSSDERFYRSGDSAFINSDRELIYLGRIDNQVQLRGFRIEPGEIETVLNDHHGIERAVVICREDNMGKYLAAYYTERSPLSHDELREHLKGHLPEYMVPSWFIRLEEIPLTSNGKTDTKALPAPEAGEEESEMVLGDKETLLSEIWQEILGLKNPPGRNSNFFELGGDSIKAIQVMSRLSQQGLKGEVAMLFNHSTIKELAPWLQKNSVTADQSRVSGEIPLTPVQSWFFHDVQCNKNHYNHSLLLNLKEEINEEKSEALRAAACEIINHHDALRMEFSLKEEVLQYNRDGAELIFHEYDLRKEENPGEALTSRAETLQRSFDLEKGDLIVFAHFRLKEGDRLLILIHHLVIDGISWRILLEDLERGYREYLDKKTITLPLKTSSFKSWSEALQELKEEDIQPEFWAEMHRTCTEVLPASANEKSSGTAAWSFTLSQEETETLLTRLGEAYNTGINDILLTALLRALGNVWGVETLQIHLESHGRSEELEGVDLSRTMGWFTSIYPAELDRSYCSDIGEEIIQIKEGLRAVKNLGIGYGVWRYLWKNTPGGEPEIMFNYLGQFDQDLNTDLFEPAEESTGNNTDPGLISPYKLTYNGMVTGGEFHMTVESDVYGEEILKELQDQFKKEILVVSAYITDLLALRNREEEAFETMEDMEELFI